MSNISKVLNEPKTDFEKLLLANLHINKLKAEVERLTKEESEISRPLKIEIGKLQSYVQELEHEIKNLKNQIREKDELLKKPTFKKEVTVLEMSKMDREERIYFREKKYGERILKLEAKLNEIEEGRDKNSLLKAKHKDREAELLRIILELRQQLNQKQNG